VTNGKNLQTEKLLREEGKIFKEDELIDYP